MGSWTETCMLTNMPIKAGDEVYLISLVKDNKGLNYGSCNNYSPMSILIKGIYDDYGFIEVDDVNQAGLRLLAYVNNQTVDDVLEAIKNGSFKYKHKEVSTFEDDALADLRKPKEQTFTMVCVDALENLLSLSDFKNDYYFEKFDYDKIVEQAADWVVESEKKLKDEALLYMEGKENLDKATFDQLLYLKMESLQSKGYLYGGFVGVDQSSELANFASHNRFRDILAKGAFDYIFLETLPKLKGKLTDDELYSFSKQCFSQLIKVSEISSMMYNLRIEYRKMNTGPQNGDNSMHYLWARKVEEMLRRRVKEDFDVMQKYNAKSWGEDLDKASNCIKALFESEEINKVTNVGKKVKKKKM